MEITILSERELAEYIENKNFPSFWNVLANNCTQWVIEASAQPFWQQAEEKLKEWSDEYKDMTGYPLLTQFSLPAFTAKPIASIQDKLFRQYQEYSGMNGKHDAFQSSIVDIASRLHDLVRTRISCKYIDGAEFLATKFSQLAKDMNCYDERERKSQLRGYFAQHVVISINTTFRNGNQSLSLSIKCEIQIASELATQMWDATHDLYKQLRVKHTPNESWEWDAQSPQFIAEQLGHVIHLADGLLVRLREQLKSELHHSC
ncbi:MAG TPA: hypothetical protein VFT64_01625 [Rickettsiales bacterium]|nr:hypothetical protein [Rickettsiales bacterium]